MKSPLTLDAPEWERVATRADLAALLAVLARPCPSCRANADTACRPDCGTAVA
ncbi:hypothetical protein [Streptosporangium sandarakinum]